jgi:N-acetylmuramoyl-L-alanine amidase
MQCPHGPGQLFRYQQRGRPAISVRAVKTPALWRDTRQKTRHAMMILAIIILTHLVCPAQGLSKKLIFPKYRGIVVLDPGHGGHDIGAQNSEGIQEKSVTLRLAQMIAEKIRDDYKVVLTRTDDYWVDLPDRTAVANHLKADVFISLHTGGSFLHSVGGTCVFHYDSYSNPTIQTNDSVLDPLNDSDALTAWNQIQDKYHARSQKLAQIIQSELFRITRDPGSRTRGAPLVVLKGADMPAVLIEPGYLTNPNESKALVDEDFLALITDAIIKAIEEFLSKKRE